VGVTAEDPKEEDNFEDRDREAAVALLPCVLVAMVIDY
jgi:hypothetical protein